MLAYFLLISSYVVFFSRIFAFLGCRVFSLPFLLRFSRFFFNFNERCRTGDVPAGTGGAEASRHPLRLDAQGELGTLAVVSFAANDWLRDIRLPDV